MTKNDAAVDNGARISELGTGSPKLDAKLSLEAEKWVLETEKWARRVIIWCQFGAAGAILDATWDQLGTKWQPKGAKRLSKIK